MTNSIAICLFLLILTIFAVDFLFLQDDLPVLVGKGLDNFIEYVSFWR
ncbi:hypothetical protein [Paracoccus fistulariae]|uniref:Glyceraldehyde-3-phosphate dehydrogenase n=1 Tax=Paracoccus fistulariae TaxID=658446 RepID=A0ABY7SK07_9RHOB|nr:hypothetical protein [Paracoccus fistulariae]MDB6180530.1 hypothetical protein [Paracoccus fistulariae]WCR07225.1 hypothetical protein JHX87_17530 [Paracoccus fistulariae]